MILKIDKIPDILFNKLKKIIKINLLIIIIN
jgi:hypothetical protein